MDDQLVIAARMAAQRGMRRLCQKIGPIINRPHGLPPLPVGKFEYEVNLTNPARRIKKYNLLRHFGALWSIITTANAFPHNMTEIPYVLRGLEFTMDHRDVPNGERVDRYLLWHDSAKLGLNALALLAHSEFIRVLIALKYSVTAFPISEYSVLIDTAEKLAGGIIAMRKLDGSFIHKLNFPDMTEDDFTSEYYVGEALLALGHWHRTCQLLATYNVLVQTRSAVDTFSYLDYPNTVDVLTVLSDVEYGVDIQSHWMLYAVAQAILQNILPMRLVPYLHKLAINIVEHREYRERREATPIACRSEGLLAAVLALRKVTGYDDLIDVIMRHVEENIKMQLQWAEPTGDIIHGDDSRRVRIDYIQHNISAFTLFVQVVMAEKNAE